VAWNQILLQMSDACCRREASFGDLRSSAPRCYQAAIICKGVAMNSAVVARLAGITGIARGANRALDGCEVAAHGVIAVAIPVASEALERGPSIDPQRRGRVVLTSIGHHCNQRLRTCLDSEHRILAQGSRR
jgi:hypothetical protein